MFYLSIFAKILKYYKLEIIFFSLSSILLFFSFFEDPNLHLFFKKKFPVVLKERYFSVTLNKKAELSDFNQLAEKIKGIKKIVVLDSTKIQEDLAKELAAKGILTPEEFIDKNSSFIRVFLTEDVASEYGLLLIDKIKLELTPYIEEVSSLQEMTKDNSQSEINLFLAKRGADIVKVILFLIWILCTRFFYKKTFNFINLSERLTFRNFVFEKSYGLILGIILISLLIFELFSLKYLYVSGVLKCLVCSFMLIVSLRMGRVLKWD